jgi:hypothetical protein
MALVKLEGEPGMPPSAPGTALYLCCGCKHVFSNMSNLQRHWANPPDKHGPSSPCCARTYVTVHSRTKQSTSNQAQPLLAPVVAPADSLSGPGPATSSGTASGLNYASVLLGSGSGPAAAAGTPPATNAAEDDAWDDMEAAEGMPSGSASPLAMEQDDPDQPNRLAGWPTDERQAAIAHFRPVFRLKQEGGASEQVPQSNLPEKDRSRDQAYMQHARTACRGNSVSGLAMKAYAVEPAQRAKLGTNWSDQYNDEVRGRVDAMGDKKTTSFLMACNFMGNWLTSQAGQDAFLRLMSAPAFDCKDVRCQTFAQMQAAIMANMPDMLRSKQWPVTILGLAGQSVQLLFADGSPVTLWYHNAWEVGLRMYADPANKGKSTLRPTPEFTEDELHRIFCSFASGACGAAHRSSLSV